MTRRGHLGKRRHRVDAKSHDGTIDAHGQPTYQTAGDWDTVVAAWPCEIQSVDSETLSNATVYTTHIFFGDYAHGVGITSGMRLTTQDGVNYDVVAAYDPDGDRREIRVDAKREVNK